MNKFYSFNRWICLCEQFMDFIITVFILFIYIKPFYYLRFRYFCFVIIVAYVQEGSVYVIIFAL